MVALEVDLDGPWFNGQAERVIGEFLDETKFEIGKQALAEVHTNLDTSIRNPTPYYETQLIVERSAADVVVHDRGIVYGPWLEGVGSRNRTTRFKGYFSFRRATHRVRQDVPAIANRVFARYAGRLGA